MRKLIMLVFLFVITLYSCENEGEFSWLEGNWIRVDEQGNKQTFEQWNEENGVYTGLGLTISEGDTVFREDMTLQKSEGRWALVVKGVNESPTSFNFIEQDESSFVCENQANEFPKLIKYFIAGDTLKAVISNDEMTVNFNFLK